MQTDPFAYLNPSPALCGQDTAMSPEQAPLAGKSFVIQPNLSVRGWPAEAGSLALKGFVALEDATVVERLRTAGATLLGSARMSEMGLGLAGDTVGQILSAARADMALMTDMMGEARLTAARIGLYGFKPTQGIVSRFGLTGLAPSLESHGMLARTPEDIAALMNVIAGDDGRDFSMQVGRAALFDQAAAAENPLRSVGIIRQCLKTLDEKENLAFGRGLERLKASGCSVTEVELPDYDLFRAVHHVIGAVEASSSCGKFDGVRYGHRTAAAKNWNDMYLKTRAESFGPLLKMYLFQGAYFQFENYGAFEKSCRIRARLVQNVNQLFAGVDALASPTRRCRAHDEPAAGMEDLYDDFVLTLPANVAGIPAVQIPGYCSDAGTDCGFQLLGPRLSDASLLAFAGRLSHATQGA
jgi:aspartyl-tRNA(Asn)/glutamyl-tRNA(Gln) amidotransferase subunit A